MKCRHCGSGAGFSVRMVSTYTQYYDFEGNAVMASEPHAIRGGTIAYCAECDRRLGHAFYRHGTVCVREMMPGGLVTSTPHVDENEIVWQDNLHLTIKHDYQDGAKKE